MSAVRGIKRVVKVVGWSAAAYGAYVVALELVHHFGSGYMNRYAFDTGVSMALGAPVAIWLTCWLIDGFADKQPE